MKLIVMDMDGTLLNSDKKISAKTKEELMRWQAQGHTLVLSSGRVKSRLDEYARELDMDTHGGYLIEANGSCVYSYANTKRTVIRSMSYEEGREIWDYMKRTFKENEIIIMGDINAYIHLPQGCRESGYFNASNMESLRNRDIVYIDSVDEIPEMFFKVCTFAPVDDIQEMARIIARDLSHTYWSGRTMPYWLEIFSKEISKGNALSSIMDTLGVKAQDVYVFGDGENDISMMKVGHGVAMENAIESVKDVAQDICASNDNDGIAQFLHSINKTTI